MIHGYISLSGLNSFLIVQNFPNSAHPNIQCTLVVVNSWIVNNLSLVNIFGETGRLFYNINYILNSKHLSLVNKIGAKTEFTITSVPCISICTRYTNGLVISVVHKSAFAMWVHHSALGIWRVHWLGSNILENCSKAPRRSAGTNPLLESASTVPRLSTGGAGAKPLLGSANNVCCYGLVMLG